MTHICVSELTIIGSDNGLSPGRRQAIIWTNDGILLIGSLGTNFSQILIKIYTSLFKKTHWKMSSRKWWPSCLGINVLIWGWSNQTVFTNIAHNLIIYTQVVELYESRNHQNNSCITIRFVNCNEGIETQYFTLWLYNGVHVQKIIKVYPVIKVNS